MVTDWWKCDEHSTRRRHQEDDATRCDIVPARLKNHGCWVIYIYIYTHETLQQMCACAQVFACELLDMSVRTEWRNPGSVVFCRKGGLQRRQDLIDGQFFFFFLNCSFWSFSNSHFLAALVDFVKTLQLIFWLTKSWREKNVPIVAKYSTYFLLFCKKEIDS